MTCTSVTEGLLTTHCNVQRTLLSCMHCSVPTELQVVFEGLFEWQKEDYNAQLYMNIPAGPRALHTAHHLGAADCHLQQLPLHPCLNASASVP